MDNKGRGNRVVKKGSKAGRSILTEKDVRDIRMRKISQNKLANKYGVSRSCIQHAQSGLNWKHV